MSYMPSVGSAPASGTVMQDCGPPSALLSAVQPRNFLLDVFGCPGDSGALVVDGRSVSVVDDHYISGCFVGMYLGVANVRTSAMAYQSMGFCLELDYAMTVMNAQILTGVL